MIYFLVAFLNIFFVGQQTDFGENDQIYLGDFEQTEKGVDRKLIKLNQRTGEEEVLIESTKAAIPELQRKPNLAICEFARPAGSNIPIFAKTLVDTDNPISALYSFDPATNIFQKMRVNEIYERDFYRWVKKSPDQTKFLLAPELTWAGPGKPAEYSEIYLIDLLNDSYKKIVELEPPENLNAAGGVFSSFLEIEWIDDNRFRYAVFENKENFDPNCYSQKQCEPFLKEYREFEL